MEMQQELNLNLVLFEPYNTSWYYNIIKLGNNNCVNRHPQAAIMPIPYYT